MADLTFTTPGASTFVVPANVTLMLAACWGGGGGGEGNFSGTRGGGGGGGGAYASKSIAVTPGQVIDYTVGTGGSAGGGAGGTSHVVDISTVMALGGEPGLEPTGGIGGSAAGSIGDTKFSGGNGGDNTFGSSGGAGGGSSAGPASDGNDGSTNSGATGGPGGAAVSGGGEGGDGANSGGFATNPTAPGGGGGGSGNNSNGTNGADGRIEITFFTAPTPVPSPDPSNTNYYNEFIGNFGFASTKLNHTQVLNVFSILRPSGLPLQNDPSIGTGSDTDYIKVKVTVPNSGTVYERIRFKPTQMEPHMVHLASGLTMDMRLDSITNSSSGIMEVWLDHGGSGYIDSSRRWWYSGPIGLPSGMNQLISVSKPTLDPTIDGNEINEFGNITVHVKYENQVNNYNELNIYSMKLCGEHAFSPISMLNSVDLHLIGSLDSSGTIPLYTYGHGISNSGTPLFIHGDGPVSGYMPLYTVSAPSHNSGIPLFIRGGIATYMNLFLKAVEPIPDSGDMLPLSIWGTAPGTVGLRKSTPLYIDGDNHVSGSMNLYIGGNPYIAGQTSNMNLFLETDGDIDENGNVIFSLNQTMALYMNNDLIASGIPMYLEGAESQPVSGSMNLYISRATEGVSHVMPLVMNGPSGSTNNVPLFLHAQPNIRNNTTMYISGVAEQFGTLKTYVHGF
jgi:hypothetical protein